MDVAAANTATSRELVGRLVSLGVRHACITPGSRSTPLTIAFAEQGAVRPWLHLDERAAAFFALGLARATGQPVALVCTTGTAAANYLPAVVEANLSRIPLIVCTTDRPPRLREVGAEQTIDQVGIFGRNVRWAMDLPLPDGSAAAVTRVRAIAERAVRAALGALPGPVHLNVPYDEPLIGGPADHPAPPPPPTVRAVGRARPQPAGSDVAEAAAILAAARRPLVVAGPESGGLPAGSVAALARAIGAPILADALSGLRTGDHDRSLVLDGYDALLRDARALAFSPDAVIRFGGVPTSKVTNQYLARLSSVPQVLVDLPGGWRDPNAVTTLALPGDPAAVAANLAATVVRPATEPGWAARWRALDDRAGASLRGAALAFSDPFEGRVFLELQAALPAGSTIVAGNSMPVRDLDSFLASDAKPLSLASNRGANGIDGVTSSALGAAAAGGGPVVLVIGDLSFYHDLSGLWAARRHGLDLTVVLVNNDGGGIFHYLPQAAHGALFEEWFGTPSGLDFRHASALFGGEHVHVDGWSTFRGALAETARGLRILELRTDRVANVEMHRRAWAAAAEAAFAPETVPTS